MNKEAQNKLEKMARQKNQQAINTTEIMYNLIIKICKNSSIENGLCLSPPFQEQINELMEFNSVYIYNHKRLKPFKSYAEMIILQIYEILVQYYDTSHTIEAILKIENFYPTLSRSLAKWLV